jgi:hypothetical protein
MAYVETRLVSKRAPNLAIGMAWQRTQGGSVERDVVGVENSTGAASLEKQMSDESKNASASNPDGR